MYKTWLLHVVKYYPANRVPLIFLDKVDRRAFAHRVVQYMCMPFTTSKAIWIKAIAGSL